MQALHFPWRTSANATNPSPRIISHNEIGRPSASSIAQHLLLFSFSPEQIQAPTVHRPQATPTPHPPRIPHYISNHPMLAHRRKHLCRQRPFSLQAHRHTSPIRRRRPVRRPHNPCYNIQPSSLKTPYRQRRPVPAVRRLRSSKASCHRKRNRWPDKHRSAATTPVEATLRVRRYPRQRSV